MQAFLDIFDIYLLEAVINGILLGGVLALLALGLNLIFGVIDVTWICYAELVMIGMYGMYFLVQYYGLPYWVAAPLTILLVAALGAALHLIVIAPLLTAPPINQLLATGGVLFVLQSFATVAFGIDFRNLGIRLPVLVLGEMNFSYARLLSFAAALFGMVAVYLFMTRTFTGTAIRAISQDRQIMSLMGVDTRRIYVITSALGGALAGLAACLSGAAIRRASLCRPDIRADHLPDLRARRARQFLRRLHRGLCVCRNHLARRPVFRSGMGLRAGLCLLHRHDVHPARRAIGEAPMKPRHAVWIAGVAAAIALPFVHREPYHLHILVLILIWSFAYTSWSIMGRFGLVSLGHGGFMGVGAYVTALLWNHLGVSPWIGIPLAMAAAGLLAVVVGYPCFRFRITGHYFVLVTLALSGIVLQVITATRDYTGGSLGYTPNRTRGSQWLALQFDDKVTWYLIALLIWLLGLLVWRLIDRSMSRHAMEAISEDEDAAAAAGVNVTAEKLKITVISALMTALAGALYCQYQMFISPDTVSGISVSLQMVFAAIVGGLYVSLGPTVGAVITILLAETLRIGFGTNAVGWDNLVYGVLLVLFIIFLPKGILGSLIERLETATQVFAVMSNKSSPSLAIELDRFVAPFRIDGSREFHLKSHSAAEKGGLDKDKGEKIIDANRKRLSDFQEKLYAQDRWSLLLIFQGMDAAGKDIGDQGHFRRRQSAGLRGSFVQAAVDQGTQPRFSLARCDRAARARPHRHLQPFLLRGMPGGAGASGTARQGKDSADPGRQEYLARTVRGYFRVRALSDAPGHGDPEILPQRVETRAARALSRAVSTSPPRTGNSRLPIFPSVRCGANTRPPIRRSSGTPPARWRRGMWCRPITNGSRAW